MKIVVFRKNAIIAAVLLVVVTLAAVVFSGSIVESAMSTTAATRSLPIYSVQRNDNKASVSFDAAWGNEDTQQIIDILAKYDVKATFFVVGEWVDKYPESVKALADAGHEIMNHSNTHPHMTKLSKEKMKEELTECNNKIEAVTGVKPTLFRAPFGDYNNEVIQTIRECGCYTIQWDVDSLDWKDLSAGEITKRVTERLAPGSIVLFHNAAKNTPEALPLILTMVREEGYTLVPISQLIYTENYKIDNSGRQINCEEN